MRLLYDQCHARAPPLIFRVSRHDKREIADERPGAAAGDRSQLQAGVSVALTERERTPSHDERAEIAGGRV